MPTSLTWIANTSVSWLDTAEALVAASRAGGDASLVDTTLAEALGDATRVLREAFDEHGIESAAFFAHAVPLAYHGSSDRTLVNLALRRALGAITYEGIVDDMAMALTEFKHAGNRAQPSLLDELTLRSGPIREQWDARGPGLLAGVGRRTDADLIVDSCNTFVVYPVRGGSGATHPQANSVRIAAVLTNPIAELPEVVRLAWLVATLNTDLPRYVERLASPLRQSVPVLALIPPVLDAAADVELVRPSAELLSRAIQAWGVLSDQASTVAPIVERWWRTYLELKLPWAEALLALEKMLDVGAE